MLFRFGERLTLRLTSENLGSKPLVLSQALHTYFAVSDSREIAIEGLEGARYIETLENWEERTQHGAVRVKGELDRIYLGLERDLLIRTRAGNAASTCTPSTRARRWSGTPGWTSPGVSRSSPTTPGSRCSASRPGGSGTTSWWSPRAQRKLWRADLERAAETTLSGSASGRSGSRRPPWAVAQVRPYRSASSTTFTCALSMA